jgi:hypothetical protein
MAGQQPVKPVTLTQVASVARKAIIVGGISLVVLIIGRFALESFASFWIATHPAPPPAPTRGFGVLPALKFPQSIGTPTSYKLDVAPRVLQPQSDRGPVFFMPSQRASLLSLDRAKREAANLGFILEPQQITTNLYRWTRNQPLQSTLDYNINNGTFTLKLNWETDPTFLQQKDLPTEDDAINITRSVLSSSGLLKEDIATGSAKITYLKSAVNGYTTTVSLSESDFLEVDIFRTQIGGRYDVVTDEPGHGTVRAIVSGKDDPALRFALLDYKYLPIDYDHFETYPIITPAQAFELLKSGRGYTAQMPKGQNDVIIRNIKLALYDSFTQQEYLQPIYVLEGDGGYVGYVPAVQAIWIQGATQ